MALALDGLGLPRSWKSVARRTRSGAPASAAAWTTAKMCSSSVIAWSFECESNPIAGPYSGSSATSDARVARDPQRLARLAAEQELRELAHPVVAEPAADPLTRDERDALGVLAHLGERLLVRLEPELRDEPEAAHEPQRILLEAALRDGAQDTGLEVVTPSERVDEHPVGEPTRHRVDREVAAARGRRRRSPSGSTTISKSCRPGPVERSSRGGANSIPAGASARIARSRGYRRIPTGLPATTSSSTLPCGASAARSPSASTPGTRKSASFDSRPSSSSRTAPPTRYASSAERADVVLDRLHGQSYASAMASISTSAPAGSLPTSTVERAGGVVPMWLA